MAEAATTYTEIEREPSAFDAQLEEMLREHDGEFVLFKNEQPVRFFSTYDEAYSAGLDEFGLDQIFLVSEVKRRSPQSTSPAWDAGVSQMS